MNAVIHKNKKNVNITIIFNPTSYNTQPIPPNIFPHAKPYQSDTMTITNKLIHKGGDHDIITYTPPIPWVSGTYTPSPLLIWGYPPPI